MPEAANAGGVLDYSVMNRTSKTGAVSGVQGLESPCVRNCCLNGENICLGCFRSLDEILCWHDSDVGQKRDILKRAAERRARQQAAVQKRV